MAGSSSLLPPLSPATAAAFRFSHRPRTVSVARPSSLKAFFPFAGDLRPELDDNPEAIISGEWTQNFSLLSFDDLLAYLRSQQPATKKGAGWRTQLGEVMSTAIRAVRAEQTVGEIAGHFEFVSGLPVVDSELRCLGVVSRNDVAKASLENSKVADIMSSPAITLSPEKTVKDAAAVMLKMKIHRIPILNQQKQVIGMVTRTDVFQALQGYSSE